MIRSAIGLSLAVGVVTPGSAATLSYDSFAGQVFVVLDSVSNINESFSGAGTDIPFSRSVTFGGLSAETSADALGITAGYSGFEDGTAFLNVVYTFSPTEDAPVLFTWDFSQPGNSSPEPQFTLSDAATGIPFFSRDPTFNGPASGTEVVQLSADTTYRWGFIGQIINSPSSQDFGGGVASLRIIPEPSSLALFAVGAALTLSRRRRRQIG